MGEGIGSILPDGWIKSTMCLVLLENNNNNVTAQRGVLEETNLSAK